METKHTKGNWRISSNGAIGNNLTETIYLDGDSRIGMITVLMPNNEKNYAEVHANAKLIAAAPKMLEALKKADEELAKFYIHSDRPNVESEIKTIEIWEMVKTAINDATE